MIGLLDYDYEKSTSTKLIIPNLEIMKLATYYQLEENTFCRLLSLDEQELDGYEKIYFFSETSKNIEIPQQFLRATNVIYGGTALTRGKYMPFENEIIDYTLPRIAIYKETLKQKINDGVKIKVITQALDSTYYRMYAGKNKLPLPVVLPRKRVFIYDTNIFYPDWKETFNRIDSRRPSGIYCIHPVICTKLTDFFELRNLTKFAKSNTIILDLNIPLDEVDYMFKRYKNQFLETVVKNSEVYLPLTSDKITLEQYAYELKYTLNLLCAFWARGIPIKIYFSEPEVGYNNPIQKIESIIEIWSRSNIAKKAKNIRTINERINSNTEAKEQFEILINKFPSFKTLFDQNFEDLKKRGYWRLWT